MTPTCTSSTSACAATCPSVTGRPPADISLAEARARFAREAVVGVCDTGRYRCPYFTWGEGPALLLVPGLAVDARSFLLPAAHLAAKFRCIAYDFPSGGGDGANLRRGDLDTLTADALALLDHVGVQESSVLGCSFGSLVALQLLRRQPARFTRGVLVGGFAQRRLAPAEVLLAHLLKRWHAPMGRLPLLPAVLRRSHQAAFFGQPPEVWEYFQERCAAPSIAAVAQRILLLQGVDLRPALPAVRQPVLLVTGDLDPLVPAACTAALRAGLPQSGHVELPGCGHYPQFSHPNTLAEIVCHFLCPHTCAGATASPCTPMMGECQAGG